MSKRKLNLPKRKLCSLRHSQRRNQVYQLKTKLKNLTSVNPLNPGVHKKVKHTQQLQVCLTMCDLLVDTRRSKVIKNPAGQISVQSQKRARLSPCQIFSKFRISGSVFLSFVFRSNNNYNARYLLSDCVCWFINIYKISRAEVSNKIKKLKKVVWNWQNNNCILFPLV